jgi:hypothetical protein
VRTSAEEVAGIWLLAAKIEFTIVTEGDSADIAIFDRIVFSIAYNRRNAKVAFKFYS